MAFISLSILELVHSFNIRSESSIFKVGIFKNIYLLGAFFIGVILQLVVVAIPQVAKVFDVVQLNSTQWMYTILISISPIFIIELQKRINQKSFSCYFWRHNV